ncbi:hypothetical protein GO001_34025 [Streptomyces sp. NRRL B-1677]|uniref:hypothetical protein n=1 Tax=Streptomyces sp. NRRL B-1677 TaxID=2682966 RepID=UPI001892BA95|nr:hypothetical protein [Streptomyces sp. NRRL B-1677]MBF6050133.1 hypothetical protein [Streptomyces sp. NRRL B-1677]
MQPFPKAVSAAVLIVIMAILAAFTEPSEWISYAASRPWMQHSNKVIQSRVGAETHIANSSNEKIHVIVASDPKLAIADTFVSGVLLAKNIASLGAQVQKSPSALSGFRTKYGANRVESGFKSFQDYLNSVELAWFIQLEKMSGRKFPEELVKSSKAVLDLFEKNSKALMPGDVKLYRERGIMDYFTPTGVASVVNASTVWIFGMTADKKRIVQFNAPEDTSWIFTETEVVRAKYGTLWQQDRSSGHGNWGMPSNDDSVSSEGAGYRFRYQDKCLTYANGKPAMGPCGEDSVWLKREERFGTEEWYSRDGGCLALNPSDADKELPKRTIGTLSCGTTVIRVGERGEPVRDIGRYVAWAYNKPQKSVEIKNSPREGECLKAESNSVVVALCSDGAAKGWKYEEVGKVKEYSCWLAKGMFEAWKETLAQPGVSLCKVFR